MTLRSRTLYAYNTILAEAEVWIADNYGGSGSLDEFVKASGSSRRAVQRALAHFDTSWRKLLIEKRMAEAADKLLLTHQTIRQIAKSCGYNQPAQFAKAFRTQHQMSPSEYRARYSARGRSDGSQSTPA